jgi:hypothetical protein
MKTLIMIAYVSAEIRTECLPNIGIKRYRQTSLCGDPVYQQITVT